MLVKYWMMNLGCILLRNFVCKLFFNKSMLLDLQRIIYIMLKHISLLLQIANLHTYANNCHFLMEWSSHRKVILIVTEWSNHCITIIDTASGEVINRFGKRGSGKVEFNSPNGVALTQKGHIIVADYDNDRLQVLTVEGAFVAAVGTPRDLSLIVHVIVAVHQNGKLFVRSERLNHRVQVLNPDLSFSGLLW